MEAESNDSSLDFSANIERFTGFAGLYDRYRPEPPAALAPVLTRLAKTARPELVVDLGSGTGLSTRYWADKAERVIGIEPTSDMRRQAEAHTEAGNVSYQAGFSHQTGLPGRCAQIVTCSQALHWMEPQATFLEAARILTPGGVFAAYDYDWPPTTGSWEAEAAFDAVREQVKVYEKESQSKERIQFWAKEQHLSRMQASGCFRYVKEIVLHHTDEGNAERFIGLLLSQGSVMTLLKAGYTDEQLGLEQFREITQAALGAAPGTWYWSSRIRLGIV